MKTDDELKEVAARMLPGKIFQSVASGSVSGQHFENPCLRWEITQSVVQDTEMLHMAHLIELGLKRGERTSYIQNLAKACGGFLEAIHATWQQRINALSQTKGIYE